MEYNLTYKGTTEMLEHQMKFDQEYCIHRAKLDPTYKDMLANSWLSEFDESILEEAERLNAILPLIKWCVQYNMMTYNLEGELALYYKDYTQGKLDDILADYEAEEVIADLVWCYQTHFAKK